MRNTCYTGDGVALSKSITELICRKNIVVSGNVPIIIMTHPYNRNYLV